MDMDMNMGELEAPCAHATRTLPFLPRLRTTRSPRAPGARSPPAAMDPSAYMHMERSPPVQERQSVMPETPDGELYSDYYLDAQTCANTCPSDLQAGRHARKRVRGGLRRVGVLEGRVKTRDMIRT